MQTLDGVDKLPKTVIIDNIPKQEVPSSLDTYMGSAARLTLPETLLLFKNLVQRGEPWNEECETAYDAAQHQLSDLETMMRELLRENQALRSIGSHRRTSPRRKRRWLTNLLIGCLGISITVLAVWLVANGNGMLILVVASFILYGLMLVTA